MTWQDLFYESFRSLKRNMLRSLLSIVGVVFGVASMVAMVAIGLGAEKQVEEVISSLGAQNIHIVAKKIENKEWSQYLSSTYGLSYRDEQVVSSVIPSSQVVSLTQTNVSTCSQELNRKQMFVVGSSYNLAEVLEFKIIQGRMFASIEEFWGSPVGLLGEYWAKKWFTSSEKAIGQSVHFNGKWFTVIGVIADQKSEAENKSSSPSEQNQPVDQMSEKVSSSDVAAKDLNLGKSFLTSQKSVDLRLRAAPSLNPIQRLIVKIPSEVSPTDAKQLLKKHLEKLHRRAEVLNITAAEEVIEQKRATTRLFSIFLITIAAISLIVGGIGIANVLLATMVERIREIGIRRALGAKSWHIRNQFLAESVMVCLVGGLVGSLLGIITALLMQAVTGWQVVFSYLVFLVAIFTSFTVGLLAGLYPAKKAAACSPVEALRGHY